MCGIAGVVALDGSPVPELAARLDVMSDLVAHRGPDGSGAWTNVKGSAGFAHRRLSIIDTTDGGRQPMSRNDLTVTYNGEIYNYIELRDVIGRSLFRSESDTEVLLHGYRKWNTAVVDHLRGMFAIALWDDGSQRLLLARDRVGIKPLYYFVDEKTRRLYFASEAKALLPFLPSIETDPDGLRDYLVFQTVMGDRTLFKGIRQLPPAHVLVAERGGIRMERYWEVQYERDFDHSESFFLNRAEELIEDAIKVHLRSDVSLGAYVSGGIDSGLVASLAAEREPLLGVTGFVDAGERFDERVHARAVADHASIELMEVEISSSDLSRYMEDIVYFMDYPVAGPGVLPQFVVSKQAATERKVMLGGQGGDELFGGYVRYLVAYFEQCIKGAIDGTLDSGRFLVTYESIIPNLTALQPYVPMLRGFLRSGLFGPMDRRYLALVDRGNSVGAELQITLSDSYDPREAFLEIFNAGNVQNGSYFDAMTHADFKTLLPALLHVEDRVGMAHGLESRVPLLDHPLIEFAATIPADVKFADGELKRVLKRIASHRLPNSVVARTDKMGFPVPVLDWLKGPENEWTRDVLETGAVRGRDYVDSRAVIDLLANEGNYGRTVWGYLCLELWQQRFHDRQSEFLSLNPDRSRPVSLG